MSRIAWSVVAGAALVTASLLSGCNIIGAAYVVAVGPEKAPAKFTLPPEKRVLVFVDDRTSVMGRRTLRLAMAEQATKDLLANAGVKAVIEAKAGFDAAAGESASQPLDIVTLGKNAKADLVIYVTMDGFTLSRDAQTFTPLAAMRVKVLDVNAAEPRVWPADPAGYGTQTRVESTAREIPGNAAGIAAAEESLARCAGTAVAELFYSHESQRGSSAAK